MTVSVPSQHSVARVRKAVRDVFLVIAAFALLGVQALSTLHYVLVPHHLCAVHGVLEDGSVSAGPATSGARDEHGSTEAGPQGERDEHDACTLATRNEQAVLLQRPALGSVTLATDRVAIASTGVLLKVTRAALLSCAPKTSPPARA